jgi:hypothetical protein
MKYHALSVLTLALASQANAESQICPTYYINNVGYQVAEIQGAKIKAGLIAGVMAAVAPVGIGLARATPNNSAKETNVKNFLESKDTKNTYLSSKLTQLSDASSINANCYNLLVVQRNIILTEAGFAATNNQDIYLDVYQGAKVDQPKVHRYRERIIGPIALKPTRRFKEDKTGKFVEVTAKPIDPEVRLENFYQDVKKSEASIALKFYRKYIELKRK